MNAGFLHDRFFLGHQINITIIPGNKSLVRKNDMYIIRFKEPIIDHVGPSMLMIKKDFNLDKDFVWQIDKTSNIKGDKWQDFVNAIGKEIDDYWEKELTKPL